MDWSAHFPAFVKTPKCPEKEDNEETPDLTADVRAHPVLERPIEVADIGCGFGGLLFALGPKMPETLILGMSLSPIENLIRLCRR